ncbi:TetR-like C-terminal domain-containing protein [Amycolatopsis sp. NPDC005003]
MTRPSWPCHLDFPVADGEPALDEPRQLGFVDQPALRIWGHLHGLVSLEVLGHLRAQTTNPAKLYRNEITRLISSLGLTPPSGTA